MRMTDEYREPQGEALEAALFRRLAQMVMERWPGDIRPEWNTAELGGLVGVCEGVFAERDALVAEVERLRAILGSCGGFLSGLRDEYLGSEWRESQAHRLCLEIAAALRPQEQSNE